MSKFKKLLVLEEAKTPKTLDANLNAVQDADDKLKEILNKSHASDAEKMKEYNQGLRSSLIHYNKFKDTPTQEAPKDVIEAELKETLPPSLKTKGELMLQHLKKSGVVRWMDNGELIFDGEPVKGSNIASLVSDVLRRSKSRTPPQGWEQFSRLLAETNIPQEFIGNKNRYAVQHKRKRIEDSEDSEYEDTFEDTRPQWLKQKYQEKGLEPHDLY